MPEITDAEYRQFVRYQDLGTPEEVVKKVSGLETDNKKQRDEIRDLKAAAPPEGAVVLTGDEAKAYPTLKELGKPEVIQAKLTKAEETEGELAAMKRSRTVREAADAHGYKPSVLEKLPGADKLSFEVKTEKVKDEKGEETEAKVAYVTPPEEGAEPVRLTDHAEAAWKDFLPALQAEAAETVKPETRGRDFVPQSEGKQPRTEKRTEEEIRRATEKTASYTL